MPYITVQDMRDEGFPVASYPDALILKRIAVATTQLEKWTGNFFEPRPLTITLDGSHWGSASALLQLDMPIVSISEIVLLNPDGTDSITIDATAYKIYNRHLTENLDNPDDRHNPRVEIVGSIYHPWLRLQSFPAGRRNIRIVGVFGYTDYDLSEPQGVTPALIKYAMTLLTARILPKLNNTDDREDRQRRSRLLSEKTRDQSYTLQPQYGSSGGVGAFTGDKEIDDIIEQYMSPLILGSA